MKGNRNNLSWLYRQQSIMKEIPLMILFLALPLSLSAQANQNNDAGKRFCLTLGILNGGGSLIGADLEFLLTNKFGIQAGAGFIGYGAGLNFHLKPTIKSSFISLQYWNQGIGKTFAQNLIGATYIYRSKKWFTCQIGLGMPLQKGPALPESFEQPPIMLMFSIGAFTIF